MLRAHQTSPVGTVYCHLLRKIPFQQELSSTACLAKQHQRQQANMQHEGKHQFQAHPVPRLCRGLVVGAASWSYAAHSLIGA